MALGHSLLATMLSRGLLFFWFLFMLRTRRGTVNEGGHIGNF